MHVVKSRSIYKMDSVEHNKLLKENITQKYELADDETVNDIGI